MLPPRNAMASTPPKALALCDRPATHSCERFHPEVFVVALAVLASLTGAACGEVDCRESRTCPPAEGGAGRTGTNGDGGAPDASDPDAAEGGVSGSPTSEAAAGSGGEPTPHEDPPKESDDTLGAPCDEEEQLRCPVLGGSELWICHRGQWAIYAECVEGDACSEDGPRCKPIVAECLERDPGDAFCQDDALHVCSPDRTQTTVTECEGRCTAGNCVAATCGNGEVDPDEECDDGNDDDEDACLTSCVEASCGDGFVHAGEEECDDGNDDDSDDCPSTCTVARCGDGFVHAGEEECDDGNESDADECLSSCKKPVCGDGVVEGPEECDDGNTSSSDDCTIACKRPACGDGYVHTSEEECDDGNTAFGDGCSATCRWEVTS